MTLWQYASVPQTWFMMVICSSTGGGTIATTVPSVRSRFQRDSPASVDSEMSALSCDALESVRAPRSRDTRTATPDTAAGRTR